MHLSNHQNAPGAVGVVRIIICLGSGIGLSAGLFGICWNDPSLLALFTFEIWQACRFPY
ncbi:MAG: hypothetical protein F6K58_30120 [Symploca sp. SIO2E9]|nr:hypothetical protein [Symploca sp. SIO2E9]